MGVENGSIENTTGMRRIMKVQELRELLKTADRELLEKAFVESYKQFSKGKKEEVDQIITGIFEVRLG